MNLPTMWYAAAAAALLLAACTATSEPRPGSLNVARAEVEREVSPSATDSDVAQLVADNNRFAFDLYRTMAAGGSSNLIYSPYSISQALAMVYAGARGETAQEMQDTLHFRLPQDTLHPAFNALDLNLMERQSSGQEDAEGQRLTLNIANAIWGQQGYAFQQEYLDMIARHYGAGLQLVDFITSPEEARVTINDWVSQKTEERIKDLLPQGVLTQDTRLVLTNAIYFNASWLYPFSESATRDEVFFLLDGSRVNVPMMQQEEDFAYGRGEGYQAVELPYAGWDTAMLIILPDEGQFASFDRALDAGMFDSVRQGLGFTTVDLTMPRFKYEYNAALADTLEEMGMPLAFKPGAADFSGIDGTRDLFISDVLHKAFVQVDESGTEAAAATAVIVAVESAVLEPPEPITLRLDRPFIFTIYDRPTGTVLFVGRVLNPAE